MNAAHLLLDAYAKFAGLTSLSFNEDGCARLRFGEDVSVNLEADANGDCIHLYAVLGPLPAGPREPLYADLLEANLFGQATGGSTLAVDSVQQELVLCRRADMEAGDVQQFAQLLDAFAAMAMQWQQRIMAGPAEAPRAAPAEHAGWSPRQLA